MSIVPMVLIVAIFFPIIFGNKFISNGDVIFSFYEYFFHAMRGGPVISQGILLGFPLLASNTGTWFFPAIRLLGMYAEPMTLYSLSIVVSLVFTYVFSYGYIRKFIASPFAYVAGATIAVFSGQNMLWVESHANVMYYPILPLVLFLYELIASITNKFNKFILWIAIGLALGLGWRVGHVQYIVYIHTFIGIYVCARSWFVPSHSTTTTKQKLILLTKEGVGLFGAYLVSFLYGLPQIAAIMSFRPETMRAEGVGLDSVYAGAYQFQDAVRFFLPFIKIPHFELSNPNLYIGILSLLLLCTALVSWKKIQNFYFRFWYVVFIFCILHGIKYSPLAWLTHQIPLWDSFREAPRLMFIGWFAGACLIAYIINQIIDDNEESISVFDKVIQWYRRIFIFCILPLISLATIVLAGFSDNIRSFALQKIERSLLLGNYVLPYEHYVYVLDMYMEDLWKLTFTDYHVVFFVLMSIVAVWGSIWVLKYAKNYVGYLIVGVVMINFAGVYIGHYEFIEREQVESEPETVSLMKKGEGAMPYRYISILPATTIYNEVLSRCGVSSVEEVWLYQKEFLQPNLSLLYGIDAVDGYDNFMPERVSKILSQLATEQTLHSDSVVRASGSVQEKIEGVIKNRLIYKFLNIRYVVSGYPIIHEDFKLVSERQVGSCGTKVYLYELSDYMPRYYVTTAKPQSYDLLPVIAQIKPQYEERKTVLNVQNTKDGYLVIGNAFLADYVVTLDGQNVKPELVMDIFMGLPLKQGVHTIEISFPAW